MTFSSARTSVPDKLTKGAYVPAQTLSYELGQIYDEHLVGLTRGTMDTEKRKRFHEQFQWFGVAALILLLAEMLIPPYRRAERTPPEVTS